MSQSAILAASDDVPPIDLRNLTWVALGLLVLVAAIVLDNLWLLNFIHVMAGVMWTGIDLFMGFVIGPILRRSPIAARRAIVLRLMPKTLFLLPTLAAITGTAGWYHARQLGLLNVPYPAYWWVLFALAITAVLTVQGLAVLLPANLLVYFEMRKPTQDGARIRQADATLRLCSRLAGRHAGCDHRGDGTFRHWALNGRRGVSSRIWQWHVHRCLPITYGPLQQHSPLHTGLTAEWEAECH